MNSQSKRPKPIKLEWQGSIASLPVSQELAPVALKKNNSLPEPQNNTPKELKELTGKVKSRLEKKGRSNHPVTILFGFSDLNAQSEENLAVLCAKLKKALGCGGSVVAGEIVLQSTNKEKISNALQENGIKL